MAYVKQWLLLLRLILTLSQQGTCLVCTWGMYGFQTFDGLKYQLTQLQVDVSAAAKYQPLLLSLLDPARLRIISQYEGRNFKDFSMTDFSIFIVGAEKGGYIKSSNPYEISTFLLRYCYNDCQYYEEIEFGWTQTMISGMVLSAHPYYVPSGSDETNYVFKLVNIDNQIQESNSNDAYDITSGQRKLIFFNNLLVLDVLKQTIEIGSPYEPIFYSNTAGLCGFVSLPSNAADDLVSPRVSGTLAANTDDFQIACFYANDGQYQNGACGLFITGLNTQKCLVIPVCEFSRPQHLRTFDDKQTWLDKGTASLPQMLLVAACDPIINPLPKCWQDRINNFAFGVYKFAPSGKIFNNGNNDDEAYVFIFKFCISEKSTCDQEIQVELGWEQFSYNGNVEKFPFTLQVQGADFLTVDSFYFDTDKTSSVNSGGYSAGGINPAEYKKITFCDGTTFAMNGRNAFVPSAEMIGYLFENNCGLCGNFDSNGIDELETFTAIDGSPYYADDEFNYSKYSPLTIQNIDGFCLPETCVFGYHNSSNDGVVSSENTTAQGAEHQDQTRHNLKVNILWLENVGSKKIASLIRGACDALERRYLREVILVLNSDLSDPDSAVEAYTMTFAYAADGATSMDISDGSGKATGPKIEYRGSQMVRKATVALLDRVNTLLSLMAPLPDDVKPSIKLTYYDDCTPDDYEPPGFVSCLEKYHFKSGSSVQLRKLGKVDTKTHGKIRFRNLFREQKCVLMVQICGKGCHLKVESEFLENLDENDQDMMMNIAIDPTEPSSLTHQQQSLMRVIDQLPSSSTSNVFNNRFATPPKRSTSNELNCYPLLMKKQMLQDEKQLLPSKKRAMIEDASSSVAISKNAAPLSPAKLKIVDSDVSFDCQMSVWSGENQRPSKKPNKISINNQHPHISINQPS